MNNISRRTFIGQVAAACGAAVWIRKGWGDDRRIRFGACDWSMGKALDPEALDLALKIGLNGVEISAGDPADILAIADPALREKYKEAMARTGLVVSSVAMGLLNNAPLAEDERGPAWLEQTIDAAKDLNAPVMLLAFFGKGDLRKGRKLKEDAMKVAAERIHGAASRAKDAGVTLAIENTLSGADNLRLLDMVGDDSVRIYYDIGNSTYNGYDVPAEIRSLGSRIAQIHFKDGGKMLTEGKVDLAAAVKAIADIGYNGWIILETASPSGDTVSDFRTNLERAKAAFNALA
ncbi:MAG TPA: sugar phosphate isomerase/epimerase family protein [Candidatus Hydrogenedentes bacterium]|nr:sugar phosphate isomerase/epimerase family protein [Candidatus Hydrogenedentota bacterium]